VHEHQRRNLLRHAVFENLEVVLRQIGDELTLRVAGDDVVGHQVDRHAERRLLARRRGGRRLALRGLRRWRRLGRQDRPVSASDRTTGNRNARRVMDEPLPPNFSILAQMAEPGFVDLRPGRIPLPVWLDAQTDEAAVLPLLAARVTAGRIDFPAGRFSPDLAAAWRRPSSPPPAPSARGLGGFGLARERSLGLGAAALASASFAASGALWTWAKRT